MAEMTGWQMVVSRLKAEGVKYVFGLPGSPSCLYDALYDEPAIKPVLVRHEAAGGFMAMAHALLTGRTRRLFRQPRPRRRQPCAAAAGGAGNLRAGDRPLHGRQRPPWTARGPSRRQTRWGSWSP